MLQLGDYVRDHHDRELFLEFCRGEPEVRVCEVGVPDLVDEGDIGRATTTLNRIYSDRWCDTENKANAS